MVRIDVRSHGQAMDWALVLISQGIEPVIDHNQHGAGWGLLVAPEQYRPALDAIRLYRHENRGWPWRQEVFRPGLLFDWGTLAWVFLLLLFFALDAYLPSHLKDLGLLDTAAVSRGESWRLFTAVWLHADVVHLVSNLTIGFVLCGLVLARFGTGTGLLATYLAGVGGNLLVNTLFPGRSLGASGMVMGALGLLAAQSLSSRHPRVMKYVAGGLFGGVMLFVLLGMNPGTNVVAHLGGFLSGLALGGLLSHFQLLTQSTLVNLCGGALFSLLVSLSWYFALR